MSAAVQLHCGECGEDDDHDPISLQSCSGTDRNGNTVKLVHCSSHKKEKDGIGLARIHLTHCSGKDKDGHSVKLGHCFGGHDEDEHTR